MIKNRETYNMRRLIAAIIDWYLSSVLASSFIHFFKLPSISYDDFQLLNYTPKDQILILFYISIMCIIYFVLIPYFLWEGQTLGKRLMKLKIVGKDLKSISLKQLFLREIIGAGILEGGVMILGGYLRQYLAIQLKIDYQILVQIAYLVTIASIIIALRAVDGEMLHDKISESRVIRV